jgi:hypothetical protein
VIGGLLLATLVGLVVRAVPVLRADFPLHDGGLFYVMANDLRANDFALPAFTSYNGGSLPFAYPPLLIYVAAALVALGIPLTTLIQYLPLLFSAASVPLVFVAVRALLSERHALVAAFAFALTPSAYEFMIVGGGLTRAGGMVLVLLTIWQTARLTTDPGWRRAVAAGLLGGLTVLAHPYAGAFGILSVALILAWRARTGAAVRAALLAVGVAIVTVAPWVGAVAAAHGFGPLLAGGGSRTQFGIAVASLLFEDVTGAPFSVFLGIALIGFLAELARRRYLVPMWLVLSITLLSGNGWAMAMLPLAMLIAVAIVDVVIPGLITITSARVLGRTLFVGLLCAGLLASLGVGYVVVTPFWPVSADQRAAMNWVQQETPAAATFAVVTGQPWAIDSASEWFPALTKRQSLATAQGSEWTDGWSKRIDESFALQSCAGGWPSDCLNKWATEFGQHPDYVYIAKGHQLGPLSPEDCCPVLRQSLAAELKVVYDGPGATILAWQGP